MEEQYNSACNVDENYFNWCKNVNPYESPCDQHVCPGVFWKYYSKNPEDENCKKRTKDCEMKSAIIFTKNYCFEPEWIYCSFYGEIMTVI
jgi:hypothetical protein